MAIYNPMDDMIYGDNADPAYAVREIPIGQTATETDFAPATDPRPASDLDAYAFNEFNKLIDKAVLPQYRMLTGKTLEENFGKDILARQLSMAQAFQEAGLPLDPNKESVSGAEFQDPVLRPLLLKYGYEPQSASEGLERVVETFFRAQREAREKRLRGETLTPMEEIDASFPMALLDALDFTGLIGLGLKGAFKASRAGLKYLLNESAKGTSKDVALKNFAELFPEDTKALQMSAVENQRLTIGGTSTPTVLREAEKGSGLTSSTPASPTRPKTERSGALVEPSAKAGYKVTNNSKIANAEADLWDEGKKFETREEFVKAVEKKSGVKGLNEEKIRNAKDYYVRKGQLNFGVKRLEYRKGTDEDGLYPFPEPSLTKETKKLINYINKNKDKIEPGTLKRLSDQYGASYSKIKEEFPELSFGRKGGPRFAQEASLRAREAQTVKRILQMIEDKKELQIKYPRADFDSYAALKEGLQREGKRAMEEKQIRIARDKGLIDEDTFKEIYPRSGLKQETLGTSDEIQKIIDNPEKSVYSKAEKIVTRFGVTDGPTQKLLINTLRGDLQKGVDDLRNAGAMTKDEFDISGLKDIYGNRQNYNKELFGSADDFGDFSQNIISKRLAKDIKEGRGPNIPTFKATAVAAEEASNVMTDYFRNLFLSPNPSAKIQKFRDKFIEAYDAGRKGTTDLDTPLGQKKFISSLKRTFGPQISHTMPATKAQGAAISDFAENVKINPAAHNLQLQVAVEKRLERHVSRIAKALRENNMQEVNRLADIVKTFDDAFKKRNMAGAYIVNNDEVIEVFKRKGLNADRRLLYLGDERDIVNPVDEAQKTLTYVENYFKKMIDNPDQIKFFKFQQGRPTQKKSKLGLETPIRKGMPNSSFVDDPFTFKQGGPVNMAIGGDPLTNLNQQQFSPDPAFEGQDFFQEAVDSGNLQAVNLLNLFKVFKKPKVMATPSNVKQVEQARDPMPQGVPGSQQIQPLPAGKPDFFFKSFLLDQLNLPNAPKASTPQGWREFLIKGKKVPEAEMLDTGILQYLEDTEKFYPNKKITKQELEDLYDTSPLGNLEVRVKETLTPETQFGDGDFIADQGRPKHKGAGNANIDNQADDYFEVVVNVPSLPGQERAFVNSSHFNEPNVLGFTRVGTYKNSKNETVAVIQEMQTDMLTEVRKEQERLFAMINALKRERAKLENLANTSANPDYYKNELRLFNQKYPQSRLDALETDNLIKPFPNIVAKDLIPERTANLNSIQEQINKLMMANVEQYNDPAYKTLVFDLAQQQKKIFEDLSSMNRSANYEESLRDFKVPSTTDRNELNRIANTDEYLPSSYNLRQVESFPPIPFNKQADYVDLLIKSTIKAAKGKGIDKVAIMPANVGANPRWGKSGDEAKKKFENLYDKVGVQQLKNIAKKYGGKLEIEKIIDPSKQTRGLTFLNKNPEGQFQILKQTEPRSVVSDADRDKFLDEEITRIVSGNTEPGDIVLTREIAPGQMMDYYLVEGRGDATDVGYRMIPLKEGESADDAMIKIVEYNPSEVDMYTISFDSSQLEEPMYLFKKKSGGSIDKDSLVSITDIYGEYGR